MSGVDNRIVTMKFDNREFETNAKTSLTTLQKLKESMNFGSIVGGTVRGLGAIESALSKIGLKTPFSPMIRAANTGLAGVGSVLERLGMRNPFASAATGATDLARAADGTTTRMGVLEGGVTAVSNKFIALSTIAITALSNITNKAINAGMAWAKSFTVAPIMDGLHEYETNLKSIQTVQANTDRPLTEVNKSLQELNKYSDQTIYNFSEMARNVGTFTAAGVDLQTSVSSIKGIANIAALSGSSSEQAAGAMYQLSQAIASGKVGLMDWNSVVNAGMGGKKLQGALAQTAIAMGKIDAAQVKGTKSGEQLTIMGNSFRESIMAKPGEESWLSSDILTNSLAALDGRYSRAALSAEKLKDGTLKYKNAAEVTAAIEKARNQAAKDGVKYTDEQFKELQKLSTSAFQAATKVKTLGQVFDIAKETIGSGWSASFQNIFGNLNEAKKLFTGMSQGLNDIINKNALARNNMLAAWKKQGGRDTLIDGLKQGFIALQKVIAPIHAAFETIFPPMTAKRLVSLTEGFRDFMVALVPTGGTMDYLYKIARGVFAVFDIGKQILGAVAQQIGRLFSAIGEGSGGFLDFAAGIGDSVYQFDQFLKKSGVLENFFDSLGSIIAIPLQLLKGLGTLIAGIFDGFDSGKADDMSGNLDKASNSLEGVREAADGIGEFFSNLSGSFGNIGETIGKALAGIGDAIASFLTSDAFEPALDAIDTGLLAGITTMLFKFMTGGVKVDVTGGVFGSLAETLDGVTGSLTALQTQLKANALMKIGISIAVLAGALLVLSTIPPGELSKALLAMSTGMGVLIGALVVLLKYAGPAGIAQIWAVSSALQRLSVSVLLMAFALKIMAKLEFADMLRGLVGLSAMMYILNKSMIPLANNSKGMMKAAASLVLVGIAINILAVALKIFATMSWGEMIKGLAGLTGTLLALAIGLKAMPEMRAEAIGLIALGVAMNLLAGAMKIFATMSWEEMAKGLVAMAGSLLIIAAAINMMPKTMMLQATALVAVAGAMVVLSSALKIMGSMGWEEIAKGLVTMAGAMLILAVGLNAMGGTAILGAAALLVAAGALAVLVPVLAALGSLSVGTIVTALLALVGVFTVLGLAAFVLAPLSPVILALAAAIVLLGAGVALAGVGLLAAATALGIIVAMGAAAGTVMANMLATIIKAIPPAMAAFGKGVVQFAVAIGQGAPRIATAFGRVLGNLIDQVTKNVPKLARMFTVMLNAALNVISNAVPKIINVGLDLIVSFLRAVDSHIGEIVNLAADIIVKFINGIARNIGRIIQAGVNLILKFMDGITQAINNNSEEFGRKGAEIGIAIVEGTVKGLSGAGGAIKDKLIDLGRDAWEGVKNFFGIGSPSRLMADTIGHGVAEGMAVGIDEKAHEPVRAIETMGRTAVDKMSETMRGLNDAFAMSTDINPTISPVLDLGALTKEANKMSSILATAPIMPTVSYQAAADISAVTQASASSGDGGDGSGGDGTGGGDTYVTYEHHLHSPTALDSVKIYRDGKSLIALKKEELAQ